MIEYLANLDAHLRELVNHGVWSYLILGLTVFCECGLVIAPFLPGDSLLFAAGTLAGANYLQLSWLMPVLAVSAMLGASFNYWVGSKLRAHVMRGGWIRFVRREHLDRVQRFYDRHGNKMILMARFVPFLRTYAPFFAGVVAMERRQFAFYNVFGAMVWVTICTGAGYFFGNIPIVQRYFPFVALVVITGTILAGLVGALRSSRRQERKRAAQKLSDRPSTPGSQLNA